MFTKILVPLDGSALSDGVLPHVRRLLVREDAQLLLLRVVPDGLDARTFEEELDAAQGFVERRANELSAAGASVTAKVTVGDPAAEILSAAGGASLVAMATHGRSGVSRWVRGSVAERVLRRATTPLLLCPPQELGAGDVGPRLRRFLVPLDGSERSASILPLAIELAKVHGAEVVLLHVAWDGSTRPLLATVVRPERLLEVLAPYQRRVEEAGVAARSITAIGEEATEILDAAEREGADLLALSTHGRTGIDRWLTGSVAEKVLRHCRLPLLVNRARAPEHDAGGTPPASAPRV